jgi:hypothetical protein
VLVLAVFVPVSAMLMPERPEESVALVTMPEML